MTPRDSGRRRLYRLLLRLYPRGYRERYGDEMEDVFLTLARMDEARWGAPGRVRCWVGAVVDTVIHAASVRMGQRQSRGSGGGDMVGTLVSDVRYAVRALRRRPVFTATAVGTVALGIGANASIFTVVDGLLFTPLPYDEPHELVTVWSENPELGWRRTDVSPADAWDWRGRSRTLADLATFHEDRFNMTGDGPPELVNGVRSTPGIFRLLGRTPVLGRDFADDEVGEGRDRVAILTDGFWQRRFAGDPDVLGTTLSLDGLAYTVVGILPADFLFLDMRPDVFVPMDVHPADADRDGHYAEALGRMADGVTLEETRAELVAIAGQLAEEYPESNDGWTVSVRSAHGELLGEVARQASLVLLGAVVFILLMACVNVANLLLAHAGGRAREMAVRSALGAGRGRVIRQLLTESLVLAAAGGTLGLLLGVWGYRAVASALPAQVPPVFRYQMDGSVLAYVAAVTVGAAFVFGVAPAFRTAGAAAEALRDGGRSGRSRSVGRLGSTLVVLQTAMAMVLLVGGGLLMKSIAGMKNQDFGFDPSNVLTLRIAPPSAAYPEASDLRAFWDAVEDRVGQLPGVVGVGTTQSHPLMGSNWGSTVALAGGEEVERSVRTTYASPGLFEALRFRVRLGRGITAQDHADAPQVAVVNQAFVDQYIGEGADPLAQSLVTGHEGGTTIPIVGVIDNVVERGVDDPPEPAWYRPAAQGVTRSRSLVVRTSGPPAAAVGTIQEAVWALDPALPLFDVETMEALVERRVGSYAVIANLMAAFALLSLVLGAVGIYGVTAYGAGQRTGEIGVRLAMGAERSDVVRMVVLQGARRAAIGLAVGFLAAMGMAGLLGSVLVGVNPRDPVTFGTVTVVLAGVSFLGLYLPARRAARVDPVSALAAE